jgi:hypothetical protein
VRLRGRMLDWSPLARSNDQVRPWLMPWSGAPNQIMVGGPPSHSAIKRRWGQDSWYGVHWCHHKSHLQTLIRSRGCAVSDGKSRRLRSRRAVTAIGLRHPSLSTADSTTSSSPPWPTPPPSPIVNHFYPSLSSTLLVYIKCIHRENINIRKRIDTILL